MAEMTQVAEIFIRDKTCQLTNTVARNDKGRLPY
ncbi:hypothetical protein SPHV1_1690002 [Novosphingobium sp. KN65.2]|nr:hypothetical protein SPHV1_1690002 [Novosphingobium sp. KN65.2]